MDLSVAENNIENGENHNVLFEDDSPSDFGVNKSKVISLSLTGVPPIF